MPMPPNTDGNDEVIPDSLWELRTGMVSLTRFVGQ